MMTTPPPRRGPYAKTARRREQLLDAALQVFVARGYSAGSLREVAAVAGVSLSNLMYHFQTKEDLLLSLLRRRDTDSVGQRTGTGDLVADVLAQARWNQTIPHLIALYSVLSAESLTDDHPGRDYFIERFTTVRAGFQEELELLRDAGRLRPGVDPHLAAGSITALWDGIQLQWLLQPDKVDVVAHLQAFLDLLVSTEPEKPDRPILSP
jgi:AcrR family transcriptional regulator